MKILTYFFFVTVLFWSCAQNQTHKAPHEGYLTQREFYQQATFREGFGGGRGYR